MCEMDLWNEKSLSVPPINTYKSIKTNIDIKHLYNVCREGKEFFDNEKYMQAEYTVLSRIVYRMKQKFRSAKDFKALEKLNKALDNYFEMDLASTLKQFIGLIPSRYKNEIYLPTKNLLDYILVRLQGLVKLMERVVETSKIAAYLLDKRMHTGHFWKVAFIAFSLVSRVFILARYITKFVCDLYRKLLPFSSQLRNNSKGWLPENYILPKDLTEWMDVDWLEFDDDIQIIELPTEMPDIMKFFDLVDYDDDVQFCEEYFMVDDDEDVEVVKEFKDKVKNKVNDNFLEQLGQLRGFDMEEDIGEVIKIEDSFQGPSVDVSLNNEDDSKIISETKVLKSVGQAEGRNDKELLQQTSSITLDQSNSMDQPVDYLEVEENIKRDIFIVNSLKNEVLQNTKNNKSINKFKPSNNKSNSFDKTLSSSNSDDENSVNESDEEDIVAISDTSLMEIPADEPRQISNQEKNAIDVDSDQDVITLSDTSLLEMDALKERILKNRKKDNKIKPKLNIDTKSNEENIIIIPDTPNPDKVVLNNTEESIIVLDTPIKLLKKEKPVKVKTEKIMRKAKQLNRDKSNRGKLKRAIELEDVLVPKKNKKSLKRKDHSKINTKLLKNDKNSLQQIENNSILNRKKQKTLKKQNKVGKQNVNKLKTIFRNLKKAIKYLSQNGFIVSDSRNSIPSSSFVTKRRKRSNGKLESLYHIENDNSDSSNKLKRRTKVKSKNSGKPESDSAISSKFKKKNKRIAAGKEATLHSNEINTVNKKLKKKKGKQSGLSSSQNKQISLSQKLVKKRNSRNESTDYRKNKLKKKKKQSDVSNFQNRQIGLSQNEAKHNSPNVSTKFRTKKLATNKNAKLNKTPLKDSKYFIKLSDDKARHESNVSTASTSSNNFGKRKRYWEYSNGGEEQINKRAHLNKRKRETYIPAEGRKSVTGGSSKPVKTGKTKSEKKKKKNKKLNNLGQSHVSRKAGGKLKHRKNNDNVQKVGNKFRNVRKEKGKKFKGNP